MLDADDRYLTENFEEYLGLLADECRKGDAGADLILNDWEEDHGTGKPPYRISFSYLKECECSVADIEFCNGHRFEMFAVAYRTAVLRYSCTGGCSD